MYKHMQQFSSDFFGNRAICCDYKSSRRALLTHIRVTT